MKAIREKVPPRGAHSFACFRFAVPRFSGPYHYHPEIELTQILSGEGQRLVGDHLANFVPGDLVLMGSNLPHIYFHPPGYKKGPRGASAIVLQFSTDLAGGLFQTSECQRLRLMFEKARRGLVFGPAAKATVNHLMDRLVHIQGPPRLALLLEILHTLSFDRKSLPLTTKGFRPALNADQTGRIGKICNWLTSNFQEPITLNQAAAKASLTPTSFSRFFHRSTNRTFVRFLHELRIGHACRLLLETDKTVAEIAFASGFENLSNFNRRFREMKGTTPRSFRSNFQVAIS